MQKNSAKTKCMSNPCECNTLVISVVTSIMSSSLDQRIKPAFFFMLCDSTLGAAVWPPRLHPLVRGNDCVSDLCFLLSTHTHTQREKHTGPYQARPTMENPTGNGPKEQRSKSESKCEAKSQNVSLLTNLFFCSLHAFGRQRSKVDRNWNSFPTCNI